MGGQVQAAGSSDRARKCIYWHRELPPLNAEMLGVEAASGRVPASLARRGELWDLAYRDLMDNAQIRITQEVHRLGGCYAHVIDESIDSRHDDGAGEAWLHGRFTCTLYR